MGTVIGEFLPFAIGIAISPLPIIVVILTLLGKQARTSSLGFLIGFVLGVVGLITVLTVIAALLPRNADASPTAWSGILKLALGALLLFFAVKQWRKRPKGDETPELPGWMQKVDSMKFGGSLVLGLFLAVVNPKSLVLSTSVGADLAASGLAVDELVVAIVVFTAIAASTIVIPVVAYMVAARALQAPLESLHKWLAREDHTIMCVLFVVLGAMTIGKGIGILWP